MSFEEVILEIPQGKLRGKKDTSSPFKTEFFCFHRIPYAKPPTGELRFKSPKPADGWSGIRDAFEDGNVCPSYDVFMKGYTKLSDEDSLFVNVYCKQNPNTLSKKNYPVLVYIHGGGFEFGSGNRNFCGPEYFMLHDVLLVTLNYRIGVLGFLSLQTVECPGNYGLKDQQLALVWIKNNISYFGGDPENITIFGISAGAASVHYHTLNDFSKKLFKRAIAQSGSALNWWGYARKPRENAFLLGKRLGCDTTDDKVLLDFLQKAPAKDLVLKGDKILTEVEGEGFGEHFLCFTFVPTAEPEHPEAFFTKHPWHLMKEGKSHDVPFITGLCFKEMILGVKDSNDIPNFTNCEDFQAIIPRGIEVKKNTEKALVLAKRIQDFYFKDGINLDNFIDYLSDSFFNYGVYKAAAVRAADKNIKSPTYLYLFNYEGDQIFIKKLFGLGDIKGTSHGDDNPYFFKINFPNVENLEPGTSDYKVMLNMTKLWTAFATSGIPTLDKNGFSWMPMTIQDLDYLNIAEECEMKKSLFRNRMHFWDEVYTEYYKKQ